MAHPAPAAEGARARVGPRCGRRAVPVRPARHRRRRDGRDGGVARAGLEDDARRGPAGPEGAAGDRRAGRQGQAGGARARPGQGPQPRVARAGRQSRQSGGAAARLGDERAVKPRIPPRGLPLGSWPPCEKQYLVPASE